MRRYTGLMVGIMLAVMLAVLGAALYLTARDQRRAEDAFGDNFDLISSLRQTEAALLDNQRTARTSALGLTSVEDAKRASSDLTAATTELQRQASDNTERSMVGDFSALVRAQNNFWTQEVKSHNRSAESLIQGNRLTEDSLSESQRIAQSVGSKLITQRQTVEATRARAQELITAFVICVLTLVALALYLWQDADRARGRALETEHHRLLMKEMNHRVKNLLSTVQAIASQTKTSILSNFDGATEPAMEQFYKAFEQRLFALGTAHRLLMHTEWRGVSLGDLVIETLRPLLDLSRVESDGPEIALVPHAAITMNLVIHELATNAIKYGAFATRTGTIDIRWSVEDAKVRVVWQEKGGPSVFEPKSRGFGSKLIERAAMREVGGKASLRFESTGLVCIMEMPLSDRVKLNEGADS